MKIDSSREKSKDSVLVNFVIEAALYDIGSWNSQDGQIDLLSSNLANIKLSPSSASLEFHGYMLVGKLEMPRLWSAEQVRKLSSFRYQFMLNYINALSGFYLFPFLGWR